MSEPVTIVLAEDHGLVREALRSALITQPDLTIVADVDNADAALEEVIRQRPQIALLDIDMPGLSCFDAARTMLTQSPGTRVVLFSAFVNDRYIEEALAIGVHGYVSKSEPIDSLVTALRRAAAGKRFFSREIEARLVIDETGPRLASAGDGSLARSRLSTLSDREIEILRYLARGMSKKDIAGIAHLSVNTVGRHAANIMAKLNIHDRVELAHFAIREGLITP